jgi:aryl-alcohol dehydrogenase-like predicted oxidoreductase
MAVRAENLLTLGATEVQVSRVGVGTNSWGARGERDPGKAATFRELLDAGITFFDTAEIYTAGASERTVGECMRASGRVPTILTKFFPFPWRLGKERMASALKRSLARLQVQGVDVYLLHFPLPPVSLETWMDGLADMVQAGLTRAVGVSNCGAGQVRRAHAALKARGVPLACNEVQFSLLRRAAERDGLLNVCRDLGVTVIAYRPLAQGMLTGKYSPRTPPTGVRAALYGKQTLRRIEPLVAASRVVGERHGKTPGQVALNWVICKGAIPIPGAKDPRQAAENAGALGWRLGSAEVDELDAASLSEQGPT